MNPVNININKEKQIFDCTINQVFKIYNDNFEKKLQIPKRIVEKRIRKRKYDLFIMRSNGNIIGFSFIVIFKNFELVFIDYLAIDVNYQGKGYGKLLFNHVCDYYINSKKKMKLLVLECEDRLVNMYQKWGCKKIPVNYKLTDECSLNLMVKTDIILSARQYHKIKNLLANLNKHLFLKRFINHEILIKYHRVYYYMTKSMNKISLLINSILRYIFGNSRIYYNFPECTHRHLLLIERKN